MFGRSKDELKLDDSFICNISITSAFTLSHYKNIFFRKKERFFLPVAVAVSARMGMSGHAFRIIPSSAYCFRKSWPHWLAQWHSSMTKRPIAFLWYSLEMHCWKYAFPTNISGVQYSSWKKNTKLGCNIRNNNIIIEILWWIVLLFYTLQKFRQLMFLYQILREIFNNKLLWP